MLNAEVVVGGGGGIRHLLGSSKVLVSRYSWFCSESERVLSSYFIINALEDTRHTKNEL